MSSPLSPFSLLGLSPRKWQLIILRLPSFKIPTYSGWFYLIWWSLIEGVTHAWHFSPCHTRQSVFLITSNHHHHVFKQVPEHFTLLQIPGVEEATMMRPRKSGWMIKRFERCCSANGDNDVLIFGALLHCFETPDILYCLEKMKIPMTCHSISRAAQ